MKPGLLGIKQYLLAVVIIWGILLILLLSSPTLGPLPKEHMKTHGQISLGTFRRGSRIMASVPCTPPYCYMTCAPQLATITDCEPGPMETPARLDCHNAYGVNQTFHGILFGIPEENIVACVPSKTQDFATIIPGQRETYIFDERDEPEYARDYRKSYYAYTWRKAGWDCMRHYEILASGTVPYFPGLQTAPRTVLSWLPKQLILKAMSLPGVPSEIGVNINQDTFPHSAYYEVACQMLEYTRNYLTTKAVARYVLQTMGKPNARNVLILSGKQHPDYMRDMLVHGMRTLLGEGAIEYPVFDFMYDYPDETPTKDIGNHELYGRGFTYAHRLPNISIDRSNIAHRIRRHEFDVVIYGCAEGQLPFLDDVLGVYSASEVALVNGQDWTDWYEFTIPNHATRLLLGKATYFFREMPNQCPN